MTWNRTAITTRSHALYVEILTVMVYVNHVNRQNKMSDPHPKLPLPHPHTTRAPHPDPPQDPPPPADLRPAAHPATHQTRITHEVLVPTLPLQALLPSLMFTADIVDGSVTHAVKAKVHSLRSTCDSVTLPSDYDADEQRDITSVAGERGKPSQDASFVGTKRR
jgi:hypothetical protein